MGDRFSLRAFFVWLLEGQHNLRSFSLLRILYGCGLLFLLLPSVPDRALLWGHASFWTDPEAKRRGHHLFDTLLTKSNPYLFDLGYFLLILLVVLFLVGWRTRVVTPILLIFLVSLHANNPYVLNGGDTLIRVTLVFMLFANLSEYYSLDALRRRKHDSIRSQRPRLVAPHVSHAFHNMSLILCCFQIIVVYVASGIWKLMGDEWLNGTALFYALRLDIFMTYPMINELIWQSSLLIYVSTFIALWVQTLFPLLILWRPTRIFALASLIVMHLGIAVLLGLWPFSLAMIALDMLYVRDSSWESLKRLFEGSSFKTKLEEVRNACLGFRHYSKNENGAVTVSRQRSPSVAVFLRPTSTLKSSASKGSMDSS